MTRNCYHAMGLSSLSLLVLSLVLLGTSTEAMAQDRTALLDQYDQLEFQFEYARKIDGNGSTPATRDALERASKAFAGFKQANGVFLEDALAARQRRLGPVVKIQEDPRPHALQGTYFSTDTPVAIPDDDPGGVTSTITIGDTGTISDLDVSVQITHTFVGDLFLSLEHVDTGTTVTLLDRPGVPASTFGCSNNDMDVLFDDESGGPDLETLCTGVSADPWYTGDAPPLGSLSAFDGEDISGTWELTASDNAFADTGTLDSWSLTTPDEADLWLEKTCEVGDDGTGSFHLTVTNDGPLDATGVEVQDWLPPLLDDIDGFTVYGTFDNDTGLWTIGDLLNGATAELWIGFTYEEQGLYENHADVTSDLADPNLDNNTSSCEFIISDRGVPDFVPEQSPGGVTDRGARFAADLKAGKTVEVDGATATYMITVENLGPQSTAKVQATDHLPDCLEFVSATADRGAYDVDTWIWDIGPVKVGETVTLTIVTTITDACTDTVTNEVSISRSSLPDPSDFFNLFDEGSAAANNRAEASFDAGAGRVLAGEVFTLDRNYPNPFNPTTMVPFSLKEAAHVAIRVYDMLGREVAVLVDGAVSAGTHEVAFEARTLPTGVYLIRMEAAGQVQIQRVTLMK